MIIDFEHPMRDSSELFSPLLSDHACVPRKVGDKMFVGGAEAEAGFATVIGHQGDQFFLRHGSGEVCGTMNQAWEDTDIF